MKKLIHAVAACLMAATFSACSAEEHSRCVVLAEQKYHNLAIANVDTGEIEWTWDISRSGVRPEHQAWFTHPNEVKPIYNGECLLVVHDNVIGIIRRSDHKVLWYAYSGGGVPHSAELLPDGNVVVVYSTVDFTVEHRDKMRIFKVDYDNFPADDAMVAQYELKSGHNAVWDRQNNVLWATAYNVVNRYSYEVRDGRPALKIQKTIYMPEGAVDVHDMIPVYGERKLWITTSDRLYRFDPDKETFERVELPEDLIHLKSISSGPEGYPAIVLKPAVRWISNVLLDLDGNPVYTAPEDFEIYKGRWMVDNTFSYPEKHPMPEIH